MYKQLEGMMLEPAGGPRGKKVRPEARKTAWQPEKKVEMRLAEGMVGSFHLKKPRSFWDFLVSVVGHSFVVALLILLPLYFTNAINIRQLQNTFLVAPPPPAPPPPPPATVHVAAPRVPKSFFQQDKLIAPTVIPKHIAQIKDEAPPQEPDSGVTGGVVGGVPGGQLGGVLGGILGGTGHAPAPPPPKPVHKGPYRVGGRVQAPKLIQEIQPTYPPLAKQARIQGDVVIDSVIDTQGHVTEMKVMSGSPLLVEAAEQALAQWKYQPTLLNGQPVAVDMLVTLHFQLGQNS